jgi:hypothetical protein
MNIRKSLSLGLMAAAGLCVGTTAQPAHAGTSSNVTVRNIRFSTVGSGAVLSMYLSDTATLAAYVSSSYTSCNRSWDLVKSWLSMAQAAQLSGKTVTITYTYQSSCGANVINEVLITT